MLLFPVVVASGVEFNEAYEGHLTDCCKSWPL